MTLAMAYLAGQLPAVLLILLIWAGCRAGERLIASTAAHAVRRVARRTGAPRMLRRPRCRSALRLARRTVVIATLATVIAVPTAGVTGAFGSYHGTDLLEFNTPQLTKTCENPAVTECKGKYYERYGWSVYTLDEHVTGFNILSGEMNGIAEMFLFAIAWILWEFVVLLMEIGLMIFGLAFNLNLLSSGAKGFGLLNVIGKPTASLLKYGAFQQLIALAFAATGAWALWHSFIRQRHMQALAKMGISLGIYAAVLAIAVAPERTIGAVSGLANQLAGGILYLPSTIATGIEGKVSASQKLETRSGPVLTAQDALFKLVVWEPFEVLDFGGTEHCSEDYVGSISVAHSCPVPKDERHAGPESNERYLQWYAEASEPKCAARLAYAASYYLKHKKQAEDGKESNARCFTNYYIDAKSEVAAKVAPTPSTAEFATLLGEEPDLLEHSAKLRGEIFNAVELMEAGGTPSKGASEFNKGTQKALGIQWWDTPAMDAQITGGQAERLEAAILVFIGDLPILIILITLSLGVIVAQLMIIFQLILLPFVLLIGLFPERGHALFFEWLKKTVSYLIRKLIYAIFLVCVLLVSFSISGAPQLIKFGWLFGYLLQTGFFWMLLMKRKEIAGMFNKAIIKEDIGGAQSMLPGSQYQRRRAFRMATKMAGTFASVYAGTRVARMGDGKGKRGPGTGGPGTGRPGGGGGGQGGGPPGSRPGGLRSRLPGWVPGSTQDAEDVHWWERDAARNRMDEWRREGQTDGEGGQPDGTPTIPPPPPRDTDDERNTPLPPPPPDTSNDEEPGEAPETPGQRPPLLSDPAARERFDRNAQVWERASRDARAAEEAGGAPSTPVRRPPPADSTLSDHATRERLAQHAQDRTARAADATEQAARRTQRAASEGERASRDARDAASSTRSTSRNTDKDMDTLREQLRSREKERQGNGGRGGASAPPNPTPAGGDSGTPPPPAPPPPKPPGL